MKYVASISQLMKKPTNADMIQKWSAMPADVIESFGDEGDFARQYLLNPTIFQLLGDVAGKAILDAGCGNGYLSRILRKRGAKMTGLEPASGLFQYALAREETQPLGIHYVQADLATWRSQLRFDFVVANMVLMDIPNYESALDSCFQHLRPGGSLIFSIIHPCFEETDSEYRANGYIKVSQYFEPYRIKQDWGDRFHRPLSDYVTALLKRGGRIEAIIEPRLPLDQTRQPLERERNLHVPSFIVFKVSKSD